MEKFLRMTTEQRSNLVAYLDGELDERETLEIERTLAQSPVARNEIESLLRTWELLDLLPRAKASDEFTARTMTSIQIDEYRVPLSDRAWFQRARRGVIAAGWVAGLAAAAVVGFLSTNRWVPNPSAELVKEMPVIENLDVYSEIDNIEFLKELRKSGLFNADPDHENE